MALIVSQKTMGERNDTREAKNPFYLPFSSFSNVFFDTEMAKVQNNSIKNTDSNFKKKVALNATCCLPHFI